MSNAKRAASHVLLLGLFLTLSLRMRAQGVSEQTNRPTADAGAGADSASATVGKSNAEILKELGEMRARIQQLESQLNAQSVAHPPDGQVSSASAQPAATRNDFAGTVSPAEPAVTVAQEQPAAGNQKSEPFAFADFTWLSGNPRTKDTPYATKFFTPEVRFDVNYTYDFNHPKDNTIGGSSEIFRHNEFQLPQLGVGGDFHLDNVRGRLMTQFGMYSQTQPRNDPSTARGQWK